MTHQGAEDFLSYESRNSRVPRLSVLTLDVNEEEVQESSRTLSVLYNLRHDRQRVVD